MPAEAAGGADTPAAGAPHVGGGAAPALEGIGQFFWDCTLSYGF